MNADHSQFWCLLTGPAESKPNSRMIKTKTIGVMLMASSIIEKNRKDEKTEQNSEQRTRNGEPAETFQLEEVVEFIFTLFSKALEDGHFTEREISFETLNEVRRIWIAASGPEDSAR